MNEDQDRIEGLDKLTRARAPDRDLWPGIHARLRPRRSRHGLVQFALAASLVAGMAAVFTLSLQRQPVAPGALEVAALGLGSDSRAIVEANLSIVDHAERELRDALRKQPDSQPLRALLERNQHRARDLRAML